MTLTNSHLKKRFHAKNRGGKRLKVRAKKNDDTPNDESESDSSDDDYVYYEEPVRVSKPKKHVSFAEKDDIRYFSSLLIELDL